MPRRASAPEPSAGRQQTKDDRLQEAVTLKGDADRKLKDAEMKNEHLSMQLDHLTLEVEQNQRRIDALGSSNKKPSAAIESFMDDVEARNIELETKLHAEEHARRELDEMVRTMTEEISTLRAKEVILQKIEEENDGLRRDRRELEDEVRRLESAQQVSKRQLEQHLLAAEELNQNHEMEINAKQKEQNEALRKLRDLEMLFHEQSRELETSRRNEADFKAKCQDTNSRNSDLSSSLSEHKATLEDLSKMNAQLLSAKDSLQTQVVDLTNRLRVGSETNNELSRDNACLCREKEMLTKREGNLVEENSNLKEDVEQLKYLVAKARRTTKDYESGVLRSEVVTRELDEERHKTDTTRHTMERKVDELVSRIVSQEAAIVNYEKRTRKLKADLVDCESKVEYFQDNYVPKEDLIRAKNELEIKYKIDLHSQMEKLSAIYTNNDSDFMTSPTSSSPLHSLRN